MKLMFISCREQRKSMSFERKAAKYAWLISHHSYSGISYTCSGRQDGIRVVMNIDRSGKCYEKVPTAIQFSFDGDQYILAWGNHALSAPGTLKFFKLHILKDEDLRDEIRNCEPHKLAKALMEELGMSVIEAIAQYLKKLWESFINLAKETVTAQTVEMSRFYVVVTLPAICQSIHSRYPA